LIVEDEPLVAMSLEDWLQEAGYEVCGPLGSSRETLAWLELNSPRVAILDIGLKHGLGHEVARQLKRRNIPFLIYSGFSSESGSSSELGDVPWIEKAQGRAALLGALSKLVSPTSIGSSQPL
jgi:DNA-binding NarL/FixJ family response regulator